MISKGSMNNEIFYKIYCLTNKKQRTTLSLKGFYIPFSPRVVFQPTIALTLQPTPGALRRCFHQAETSLSHLLAVWKTFRVWLPILSAFSKK